MALAPAGWYPDPSGIPGAFRWWDGATWTTAISASPSAPAPLRAAPAGPSAPSAGQPGAGQPTADQPTQPIAQQPPSQAGPGQPAHPGPDYEPANWQPVRPQPPTSQPAVVPTVGGMGAAKIAALFGGVLVLVLALGGSYLYVNRHHDPTPPPPVAATTNAPTPPAGPQLPTPSPPASPRPTPSRPPGLPTPSPSPSQPSLASAHFVFPNPGKPWEMRFLVLNGLTQWQAYSVTTQSNYDGTSDWVAIMVSLAPNPTWHVHDQPKAGLRKAAAWYEAANFAGAAVHPKTVAERAITVDGQKGRYLQVHLRYHIDGLKSTGETATLVAVPTGHGDTAMFLASIPDTNKHLQRSVDATIEALQIVR
jgi:hypothetical protein